MTTATTITIITITITTTPPPPTTSMFISSVFVCRLDSCMRKECGKNGAVTRPNAVPVAIVSADLRIVRTGASHQGTNTLVLSVLWSLRERYQYVQISFFYKVY